MSLKIPSCYGIVCKKSAKSMSVIEEAKEWFSKLTVENETKMVDRLFGVLSISFFQKKKCADRFSEDEKGAAWSVAMSPNDVPFAVKGLCKKGLVEDVDFVVTDMVSLMSGKMPVAWLSVSHDGKSLEIV